MRPLPRPRRRHFLGSSLGRFLLLAALLALPPAAAADEPAASVELAPAKTDVLIGSKFEILGTAVYPESFLLLGDVKGQPAGEFEILDIRLDPPKASGGRRRQDFRIRAAVFGLGRQTLPALNWTLRSADGSTRVVSSPPVEVTVRPPKPGIHDQGDIQDIKGPYGSAVWHYGLAAVLLVLLAAAAAWHLYRRLHAGAAGAAPEPPDPRTPEEIALSDIESLMKQGLPVKEFYDRLSDIVRLCIERRSPLQALSMTTYDLQRGMIRLHMDPEARSLTKSLLARCDLAKFARFLPGEGESRSDCETAKKIVRRLSPKPEEPDALAAGRSGGGKP